MAFSSRFCASAVSISAACSAMSWRASSGSEVPAEELRDQAQPHRELVGLPVVHREHPVPVVGELGELPHVVPHLLIGGVEQVRAVLVDFDPGLRLGFGIGVAADVRAPVDDEHALPELGGHALGNRQAEKSGADDEEVKTSGHRLPRVSDLRAQNPIWRGHGLRGSGSDDGLANDHTCEPLPSRFDIATLVTPFPLVPSVVWVSRRACQPGRADKHDSPYE